MEERVARQQRRAREDTEPGAQSQGPDTKHSLENQESRWREHRPLALSARAAMHGGHAAGAGRLGTLKIHLVGKENEATICRQAYFSL